MGSDESKQLTTHLEIATIQISGLKDEVNKTNTRVDKLEKVITDRLDKIDGTVGDISLSLVKKETSALRSIITVGISIIAALLGTVGGLIWYVIMNH